MIGADRERFLVRNRPEVWDPEALEEDRRCFRDPKTVHAICEDYCAAATLDYERDEADRRASRRIQCQVLVLWGSQGRLEEWYDVLDIWRGWADDVHGRALDCGHYLPEETCAELRTFFGS